LAVVLLDVIANAFEELLKLATREGHVPDQAGAQIEYEGVPLRAHDGHVG
jgi:hypothetical protein